MPKLPQKRTESLLNDTVLTPLTNLEKPNNEDVEECDQNHAVDESVPIEITDSICAVKKSRTPKQIEVFEKAKATREFNIKKKREEMEQIALEEKKKTEAKLIKKAVAIRKKQIKREQIINELSDDETDTPMQKSKIMEGATPPSQPLAPQGRPTASGIAVPVKPSIKFF